MRRCAGRAAAGLRIVAGFAVVAAIACGEPQERTGGVGGASPDRTDSAAALAEIEAGPGTPSSSPPQPAATADPRDSAGTPPSGEGSFASQDAGPALTDAGLASQNPAGTLAGSPDASPAPQDPAQTAADSLTAALAEIAEAQRLILARLDSIEARAPTPTQSDSAATGVATLEETTDDVRNLGVKIFWSLVILFLFHFLTRAVIWVLETLAERSVARRLTFKWLIPITRMALWALAIYLIILNVFRIDAQGILAASAALGLAVGVAAQDALKNVLGGLTVVFDQPFQVGDKISVGGTYGEVVSIGLRSTRIVTADDNLVSIPNAQVVGEQVANANAGQLNCQVVTRLHLPGQVEERLAKRIALEAALTSPYVYLEKPVGVLVADDFRTTFLTRITVRAYVLDPRFEFLFQSDVTERAREGFRAAGLTAGPEWRPWGPESEDEG